MDLAGLEGWDDDLFLEGEEGEGPGAPADAAPSLHRVQVPAGADGERLDKALAELLAGAGLSRSRLRSLIDQGHVATGGVTIDDASRRVKAGQWVEVAVPAAVGAEPRPQDIPITVAYEDEELLVVDKPAGLVVHPAAGNPDGTLVNALLAHCGDRLSGIGGVRRPGIVHRLDKDTSGLMVVAKTDRAHRGLAAQFADRSLSRTYLAVVWGTPVPREGRVEGNIGRHPTDRKRMTVLSSGGKPAVTLYRVERSLGLSASLVECKLMTGRTHQIRVHMTHVGHPLVGDPVYGRPRATRAKGEAASAAKALAGFPRQALHAGRIEFLHPVTGARLSFTAPLPADMRALIDTVGSS
ncbi:RluA family pseudouridine synthase [Aerophototrophica crusticola]|uniref:Pseudouridine synthase n=2 Tax=Aerophototrophica crusticola TaxID=1709002 RepID=A0A858RC76_9PROT|nr:RluA family pseudouridine synthase [Rhodospirillaceae bacterium B3]